MNDYAAMKNTNTTQSVVDPPMGGSVSAQLADLAHLENELLNRLVTLRGRLEYVMSYPIPIAKEDNRVGKLSPRDNRIREDINNHVSRLDDLNNIISDMLSRLLL